MFRNGVKQGWGDKCFQGSGGVVPKETVIKGRKLQGHFKTSLRRIFLTRNILKKNILKMYLLKSNFLKLKITVRINKSIYF